MEPVLEVMGCVRHGACVYQSSERSAQACASAAYLPPMPRPRERAHRKPGPLPTPAELLGDLVAARGAIVAPMILAMIRYQLEKGTWEDGDRFIRQVQALADAGALNEDERYFLISYTIDRVLPSRAALSPAFVDVERRMREFREARGLNEDDLFRMADLPPEYRSLEEEWSREADRECARWMRELGERDVAHWLERNREELAARHRLGADSFVPPEDDE